MPENEKDQRTEPATPKRREEARNKGQIAQSREVNTVFVLLSSLTVFYFLGKGMVINIQNLLYTLLKSSGRKEFVAEDFCSYMTFISGKLLIILLPLFAVVIISGILAQIIQVGFLATLEPLKPSFSKINPMSGFKRLFSKKSIETLVKSVLKIFGLALCAYFAVKDEFSNISSMVNFEASELVIYAGEISFRIFKYTIGLLIVIAAADYLFIKKEYEDELKMTKEEIKQEFKQREGDPLIKSRIRSIQRELARKRMMEDVPKADVVITNPTHIAVALLYEPVKSGAPRIVAKGQGYMAERIKEIARRSSVPIVENKPLARTLFKLADVGMEVPPSLYKSVAEVLAYLYRLRGKLRNM